MVSLQPVTEENYEAVIELKAPEELVADNTFSLAQAYISLKESLEEGEPEYTETPYAIMNDDEVVGFLMFTYEDGEDINAGSDIFWLSRFMIDNKHQGKGYGKAALALFIDLIRSKPHGKEVSHIYTSVVPIAPVAPKLYESMGFVKTGGMIEDEELMKFEL